MTENTVKRTPAENAFGTFMAEMIKKYGGDILARINEKEINDTTSPQNQ